MTQANSNVAVITLSGIFNAINEAQDRYSAKKPDAALPQKDLQRARKYLNDATVAAVAPMLEKAGVTPDMLYNAIAKNQPVKATMRMCEWFHAISAGDYKLLDVVTVNTILSAVRFGAVSSKGVFFATTGIGDDTTSDHVKNTALVRKLHNAVGKVGATTSSTQVSRSFGKNGFAGDIGLGKFVRDESGERRLTIDGQNPFYRRVAHLIDVATENTLRTMRGAKDNDTGDSSDE
jgi:hypothetical protein